MAGVHPPTKMNATVGVFSLHRGCRLARTPPLPDERIPTTPNVQLLPGIQSLSSSDADGSLSGFRQVDCSLRLRIDEALSSYREDDGDWYDAWHTHQPCSSSRRATLISHLYNHCEPAPEFLDRSFHRSPCLEVRPAQPAPDRQMTHFVVEPWSSERIGTRAPWQATSTARGTSSACKKGLASSPTVPRRRIST